MPIANHVQEHATTTPALDSRTTKVHHRRTGVPVSGLHFCLQEPMGCKSCSTRLTQFQTSTSKLKENQSTKCCAEIGCHVMGAPGCRLKPPQYLGFWVRNGRCGRLLSVGRYKPLTTTRQPSSTPKCKCKCKCRQQSGPCEEEGSWHEVQPSNIIWVGTKSTMPPGGCHIQDFVRLGT